MCDALDNVHFRIPGFTVIKKKYIEEHDRGAHIIQQTMNEDRVTFTVPSRSGRERTLRMLGYWQTETPYGPNTILYKIAFNMNTKGAGCVEIAVTTSETGFVEEVHLNSFNRYPKCSQPDMVEGEARYMLKVALLMALRGGEEKGLFKVKSRQTMYVTLQDESYRDVATEAQGVDVEVSLADANILTTGQTWYQRNADAVPLSRDLDTTLEAIQRHRSTQAPPPQGVIKSLQKHGLWQGREKASFLRAAQALPANLTWGDTYAAIVSTRGGGLLPGYALVPTLMRHALAACGITGQTRSLRGSMWKIVLSPSVLNLWGAETRLTRHPSPPTGGGSEGGRTTCRNTVQKAFRQVAEARKQVRRI